MNCSRVARQMPSTRSWSRLMGPDFSIDDFRPDPDAAPMEPPPPMMQENAEQLLRDALTDGENSGDPTPFDFDAFLWPRARPDRRAIASIGTACGGGVSAIGGVGGLHVGGHDCGQGFRLGVAEGQFDGLFVHVDADQSRAPNRGVVDGSDDAIDVGKIEVVPVSERIARPRRPHMQRLVFTDRFESERSALEPLPGENVIDRSDGSGELFVAGRVQIEPRLPRPTVATKVAVSHGYQHPIRNRHRLRTHECHRATPIARTR